MKLIDQLLNQVIQRKSASVVGLDPLFDLLPPQYRATSLKGASQGLVDFNLEILDAISALVPAVKLQMACYELYGSEGVWAFEQTVQRAKKLGLFVIDDSKRGDIGSTAKLYAQARIGCAPLSEGSGPLRGADFVTVNPFLGQDGLEPFYQVAQKENKGVFVLVRTSNPSSGQYQTATIQGRPLFEQIALDVEAVSRDLVGDFGYSSIGAVVGATWPDEASKLRRLMPSVPFLVPGYGSQGGCGDDVVPCFDEKGLGALVSSSRGILYAYQAQGAPSHQFARCAKEAVGAMNHDIHRAFAKAGKLPKGW